jgi:hypothetical protein
MKLTTQQARTVMANTHLLFLFYLILSRGRTLGKQLAARFGSGFYCIQSCAHSPCLIISDHNVTLWWSCLGWPAERICSNSDMILDSHSEGPQAKRISVYPSRMARSHRHRRRIGDLSLALIALAAIIAIWIVISEWTAAR